MHWIEEFFFSPIFAVSFLWAAWRMLAMVVITFKQLKLDWNRHRREQEERRREEDEPLQAWPPLELTPEERAAGWSMERNEDGARYKALTIEASSPRRRPFLERHKGPWLTKEDITSWWEELKDHEF